MEKRYRYVILIITLALVGAFLIPTVKWYFFTSKDLKATSLLSRNDVRGYAIKKSQEDADRLVSLLEKDKNTPIPPEFSYFLKEIKEKGKKVYTVEDVFAYYSSTDKESNLKKIRDFSEDYYRKNILNLKEEKKRVMQLGLDIVGGMSVVLEPNFDKLQQQLGKTLTQAEKDQAISSAILVLSSRIDQFGISEPNIRKLEGNRILVEIPGDNDPERVNSFLRGAGSLRLQIVDDEITQQLQSKYESGEWKFGDDFPLPPNRKILPYVKEDTYKMDRVISYLALKEDAANYFDGSNIKEAQVSRDELGNVIVVFNLKSTSTKGFFDLTRANVGKSLAIVLDGKVKAYAKISGEIPNGNVSINGFSFDDATSIATVLRTASLPVELQVVNQQTVGSSLSSTLIKNALYAIVFGFASVVLFMLIYYKKAGFFADIALLFNLFFMMAILSSFGLTLTLTGIAGIILTIGMSVDANVIIFERIKEELRAGKSVKGAIDAGFKRAFLTIFDSNITTFIAAIFLSYISTGPIQGFAVTLSVGIFSSMFSSLFVSRLIFDTSVDLAKIPRLSILWRKR